MALWDIAGKRAGMPVFQLLGGAMRDRIEVYRHADGSDPEALIESAQRLVEAGHRYVRCQIAGYGAVGAMTRSGDATSSSGNRIDPRTYIRATIAALEAVRERLGDDIELLHDVHERIEPIEALGLARELERFRLFFLEDAVAIEQLGWLRQLRAHSATPLAIGELFTSIDQWLPLMQDRLIDFIRVHLSDVGGITPALRLSRVAEAYGVRTAFHGPGDLSPFGHAANVHLDFALPNFGIQEMYEPSTRMAELFPGMLEVREGAVDLPTRPGLGVDVDEEALAAFECRFEPPSWTEVRKPDGGLVWP
jgi:mannonate dehydratase